MRLAVYVSLLLLAVCCGNAAGAAVRRPHRVPRFRPHKLPPGISRIVPLTSLRKDLIDQCQELWRDATLDHFTWGPGDLGRTSYRQRFFVCDNNWGLDDEGKLGPIFFYLGNEADVTLYLNNSGLMWESAHQFRALLVFAEHRYYGKSLPYGKDVRKHMQYLSTEQAMADYAQLIEEIQQRYNATKSPVIGFGGSYGGMLAAWMRMKYPHVLDGAVAASAPIWNFENEDPAFDPLSFAKGVTWDASAQGGAIPECADNVREAWRVLMRLADNTSGLRRISRWMGLCDPVTGPDDVAVLRDWLASAWDYMAMGNFPYESGYILNGQGTLPAFPVRAACSKGMWGSKLTDRELMEGLAQAAGVYYNYSGSLTCLDWNAGANPDSDQDGDFWSYQYCTEQFMPEAKDGVHDMFWDAPWDPDAVARDCLHSWNVTPRRTWAQTEWGGRRIQAASRIVFSNGLLDPWHGGGVLRDVSDSLPALVIPEGAHHLDLMFSHPDDPQSVIQVRQRQREFIRLWVQLARLEQPGVGATSSPGTSGVNAGAWYNSAGDVIPALSHAHIGKTGRLLGRKQGLMSSV